MTTSHRCPRSEHVLLAAISPKLHSPAAAVLAECGAEPAQIRDLVTRTMLKEAPALAGRMRFLGRVRMRGL